MAGKLPAPDDDEVALSLGVRAESFAEVAHRTPERDPDACLEGLREPYQDPLNHGRDIRRGSRRNGRGPGVQRAQEGLCVQKQRGREPEAPEPLAELVPQNRAALGDLAAPIRCPTAAAVAEAGDAALEDSTRSTPGAYPP